MGCCQSNQLSNVNQEEMDNLQKFDIDITKNKQQINKYKQLQIETGNDDNTTAFINNNNNQQQNNNIQQYSNTTSFVNTNYFISPKNIHNFSTLSNAEKKEYENIFQVQSTPNKVTKDMCFSPRSLVFKASHEVRLAYVIENTNYAKNEFNDYNTPNNLQYLFQQKLLQNQNKNQTDFYIQQQQSENDKGKYYSQYHSAKSFHTILTPEHQLGSSQYKNHQKYFKSNQNQSQFENLKKQDKLINQSSTHSNMNQSDTKLGNQLNQTGLSKTGLNSKQEINESNDDQLFQDFEILQEESCKFGLKYYKSQKQMTDGKKEELIDFLTEYGFEIYQYQDAMSNSTNIKKLGMQQIYNQISYKVNAAQLCQQPISILFVYTGFCVQNEHQEQCILTTDYQTIDIGFIKNALGSYAKAKILGINDSQVYNVNPQLYNILQYEYEPFKKQQFFQQYSIIQNELNNYEIYQQKPYQFILNQFLIAVRENKTKYFSDILQIIKNNQQEQNNLQIKGKFCDFVFLKQNKQNNSNNNNNNNADEVKDETVDQHNKDYKIISFESQSQQQMYVQSEMMVQINRDNHQLKLIQKQQETKLNKLAKVIDEIQTDFKYNQDSLKDKIIKIEEKQIEISQKEKNSNDMIQLTFQDLENQFTGVGKIITPEGVYEGQFFKGYRQGKGKFTWTSYDVYEGDWINDKRSGYGIFTWGLSKNKYEGEFKNNYEHGKGKFTWAESGNVYEGDFIRNEQTGKGKFIWKSSNQIYEGDFYKGCFQGFGKLYKVGGEILYEGEWKDDQMVK